MATWGSIRQKYLVPALLVLVVTFGMALIYWPIVSHPAERKFYGYGDSWTYYGPTQFYADYVLHHGEFPLWNPLILCGQPIAGNPQYAIFYPPNMLRRLVTFSPTPWKTEVGMAILLYLHVISAALGTYAFGRTVGLSRLGAFTAGAAFAFSGAFTQRIFGHLLVVMVVSWLPWCLCCLRISIRAESAQRALAAFVGLGVAYSMAILAGTPQMTLLVGFALVLYWALERAADAVVDHRNKQPARIFARKIGRDVAFGALAIVLAAGLSAPMAVPALQFFGHTPRGTESTDTFEKTTGDETFHLSELLAAYTGGGNYEGIKTLSAAGIVFALAGLFSPRRREAIVLAAMSLLLLDASLEHSVFMLHVLMALSPFPISSPARGMMAAVLPMALLAGFGVDALRDPAIGRRARIALSALGVTAALGMTVLIVRRLGDLTPPMSATVAVYPLAAVAVLLAALWRPRLRLRWLALVPVCLLIAEAVHWRGAYIRHLAPVDSLFYSAQYESDTNTLEFWRGISRGVANKPNVPLYGLKGEINGFDAMPLSGVIEMMMPGDESNPFWRAALPVWMAETTDRTFLLLKRSFWLHRRYVDGPVPGPEKAFAPTTTVYIRNPPKLSVPQLHANDVLGVPYSEEATRSSITTQKYLFSPENRPTLNAPQMWTSAATLPPDHKSIALIVSSDCNAKLSIFAAAKPDDLQIVAVLHLGPTNGRTLRYNVPLPDLDRLALGLAFNSIQEKGEVRLDGIELIIDHADENQHIRVLSRTANTVEAEVSGLSEPRILSCIDFMYPGWHAYLDGKQVPILHAFTYFKAVEVPAGTHRIRFEFRPVSVYIGAVLWLVAVAACFLLLRWAKKSDVVLRHEN